MRKQRKVSVRMRFILYFLGVKELARGRSDIHCKIKETLLIRDLKPALNENVGSEKLCTFFFYVQIVISLYFIVFFFFIICFSSIVNRIVFRI